MKLFKSLLLASATGMVAVSGASAADLGAKKPSPVEYVRACYNPLWGTSGGFIIPGTQTCLRVGGQARFDIGYSEPFQRNLPNAYWGYRGGGNIFLDAITPSEYGNVRAFVNMSMIYRTGSQRTGTGTRFGQTIDSTGFGGGVAGNQGIGAGTDFSGSSGFIQFAGFTFGRTASFFNTVGLAPSILAMQLAPGSGNLNQAAYTAVLGNGFLATIAVEDPVTRRNILGSVTTVAGVNTAYAQSSYSNSRMPNFVGALRLDQAWGSAELTGLVSEIRPGVLTVNNGLGAITGFGSTKYGFAISGGLKINLPMLAAGDALFLNAVYTDGIVSTVTGNYFGIGTLGQTATGGANVIAADAVFDPISGSVKTTKAWGINVGFQHFWTPTISTSITGSYGEVDTGVNLNAAFTRGIGDYKIWSVGLLNAWSPVRGLTFAVDLGYIYVDPKGRVLDINRNNSFNNVAVPGAAFTKGSDGQFLGRFRVVRDF